MPPHRFAEALAKTVHCLLGSSVVEPVNALRGGVTRIGRTPLASTALLILERDDRSC